MNEFDPVAVDMYAAACTCCIPSTIDTKDVPKLVANELRRQFANFDDPSRYDLILRAQELEQL